MKKFVLSLTAIVATAIFSSCATSTNEHTKLMQDHNVTRATLLAENQDRVYFDSKGIQRRMHSYTAKIGDEEKILNIKLCYVMKDSELEYRRLVFLLQKGGNISYLEANAKTTNDLIEVCADFVTYEPTE